MILLTSTTDKLQIITSAAASIDVHTSWVDNTATAVTPGRTNIAITTAATTDVVTAPAPSTQRNVKTLHVRNKHATVSTDVTVQHTDGTTPVQLYKATLVAGGMLQYVDDIGFEIPSVALPGTTTAGNVNNSGTPISGQLAQWTDATHVQGVDVSSLGYLTVAAANAAYQPLDADLTSLAALTGTNVIYYRSVANTWSPVTIGANLTFSGGTLAATGGGGGTGNVIASGTPTNGQLASWIDGTHITGINVSSLGYQPLDGDLTALAALGGTNVIYYRSGTDTWSAVTIGTSLSFTAGTLAVTGLQTSDPTLTALAALDTTAGLVEQTGVDTFTKRALGVGATTSVPTRADADARYAATVHTHAQADVTNLVTDLAAKQPLDGDLTALAALAGVDVIYYRSGTNAWSPVTIGPNITFTGGVLDSTATGGGSGSASASGFTAHKAVDQTINNATWTKLNFGATAYNHGGFFSTGTARYIPPAGETTLIASAYASGLALGSNFFIAIYKNGAVYRFATNNSTDGFVQIVCSDNSSGTDYYEVWVSGQAATGGIFTVPTGNNDGTYFQGFQSVGPVGPQGPAGVDGGISDGDKGDVIVSGTGFVWTIDNNVVTYAKMQDVSATARLLARKSAGAGDPEEASLSEVLDFIGSATRGDILFRGASAWARLPAGTAGNILTTQGAAADPTWGAAPSGSAGKHTLWVPASAMVSRATNGSAPGTIETTTNKNMIRTLDFDTGTQEFAQFEIAMPKSWDEGTVTFVPVWSHAATTTNFGVVWALQGVARSDGDALDVAFGTEQTSTDTGGTTNMQYIAPESAAITIGGSPIENDVVLFQIKRNPTAGADTLAVDARLHGVKLYYTTNAGNDN